MENGQVLVGDATIAVSGNGTNRIVFSSSDLTAGMTFLARDNDVFSPKEEMRGKVTQVTKNSDGKYVWTLDVQTSDEVPPDWPDFIGGRFLIGGDFVDIVDANATDQTVTTSAMSIRFMATDDDSMTYVPYRPTELHPKFVQAYRETYVEPVIIWSLRDYLQAFQTNSPLDVQSSPLGAKPLWDSIQTFDRLSLRSDGFWVGYLMWVFQLSANRDFDPNTEYLPGALGGGTALSSDSVNVAMAAVAVESVRDAFSNNGASTDWHAAGFADWQELVWNVAAHELGHEFNLNDIPGNFEFVASMMGVYGGNATSSPMFAAEYKWHFSSNDVRNIRMATRAGVAMSTPVSLS